MTAWARRHERLFLTTVLTAGIAVLALAALDGYRDGSESVRLVIVAVAAAGLLGSIVHQLVLWREGGLILRDRESRERNRARIDTVGKPLGYVLGGAALLVAAVSGDAKATIAALFGSLMLGYTPVLLYIAYVIRPDQRDIDAEPTGPT